MYDIIFGLILRREVTNFIKAKEDYFKVFSIVTNIVVKTRHKSLHDYNIPGKCLMVGYVTNLFKLIFVTSTLVTYLPSY